MDENNSKYDFCPKCGALTKDGVCQSCHYRSGSHSGNKRLVVGFVIALTAAVFILLIGITLYFGGFVVNEVKDQLGIQGEKQIERSLVPDLSKENEPAVSNGEDPFLADGYVNMWGGDHTNYDRNSFQTDYYESLCDSIDYDVSYGINREYYEYVSEEGNVTFKVAYIQLEGNIPNIDTLNKKIRETTCYYVDSYFESYQETDDYQGYIEYYSDSYISYNDENSLSVVLDENWSIDGDSGFTLYGINIDLTSGMILDNSSIISVNEEFADAFRDKSDLQNGTGISGLDSISNVELLQYLNDDSTSIVFFTPLGLEIGYNYTVSDYYGWVTVTFKEYDQYIERY